METNLQKRPEKEIKETCKRDNRDLQKRHMKVTLNPDLYARHVTNNTMEKNL